MILTETLTRIVATIGPATADEAILERLIQAGVDVVRLNFSHGTFEEHAEVLRRVRDISQRLNIPLAVLQDLPGPKIRLGDFSSGLAFLEEGSKFVLDNYETLGDNTRASVTYPDLWKDVVPGQRILLADGVRELKIISAEPYRIVTEVIVGGTISNHKGVNLPETKLSIPALTDKDRASLEWGLAHDVDYVAMSFVRAASDLEPARKVMKETGKVVPLIAKIEKPEAIENLDAILSTADGVMIARGDLGVEMAPEKVPALQKLIIKKARENDIVVITATQMLESMIQNPRPTRAEASDVANAIYDGTDAIMLSGETAIGEYPIETVEMMGRIAGEAEMTDAWHICSKDEEVSIHKASFSKVASRLATEAAKDEETAAICAFTMSGFTAKLISKFRPQKPIYALTPDKKTYNQMSLIWGVRPLLVQEVENFEGVLQVVNETFCDRLGYKAGQVVIVVCGLPVPVRGTTNTVRLHVLESSK